MVINHGLFLFLQTMNTDFHKTLLLPTSFLGPVEYFYYLNRATSVIIEQHETYPKQTYRNRTVIVTDKGFLSLIIPVTKVDGNHTKTKDITVSFRESWPVKHWRSIETAYQNSPYFLYYSDKLKELFFSNNQSLVKFNTALTKVVCEMMGIKTDIRLSTGFVKPTKGNISDLRFKLSPKQASTIEKFPEYTQVFFDKQPFIPNAGILDLLFCLGPESKSYLDQLMPR